MSDNKTIDVVVNDEGKATEVKKPNFFKKGWAKTKEFFEDHTDDVIMGTAIIGTGLVTVVLPIVAAVNAQKAEEIAQGTKEYWEDKLREIDLCDFTNNQLREKVQEKINSFDN